MGSSRQNWGPLAEERRTMADRAASLDWFNIKAKLYLRRRKLIDSRLVFHGKKDNAYGKAPRLT